MGRIKDMVFIGWAAKQLELYEAFHFAKLAITTEPDLFEFFRLRRGRP